MLPEISLNILDIAQNSIRAGASLIEITLSQSIRPHVLQLEISDNGCGMDEDQVRRVTDPFYTSRSTRKVGLGLPFLKQAAEAADGSFLIRSQPGSGTVVSASFCMDHIDCMPLGDISGTMLILLTGLQSGRETDSVSQDTGQTLDIVYTYRVGEREFVLDTRELREILGDVSFAEPEIYEFLSEYLQENKKDVDGGSL